jgi:hypothetical protein
MVTGIAHVGRRDTWRVCMEFCIPGMEGDWFVWGDACMRLSCCRCCMQPCNGYNDCETHNNNGQSIGANDVSILIVEGTRIRTHNDG